MNSLKPYHDLEIDAHVSLDDVLSKTTQEMGELLTAIRDNNEPETAKESADLLINILSASSHVGIDYSLDNDGKKADEESENRAQNLPSSSLNGTEKSLPCDENIPATCLMIKSLPS